ncbi:MAG: hypothetical protein U1E42_04380 [Rhodospirillales bacterium]
MLWLVGTLLLASAPLPAAAETAVEVPEADIQSQEKQAVEDSGAVEDTGKAAETDLAKPEAVFANGCIAFPGQRAIVNLQARGTVLYRVVPDRFFDVTLRVVYRNLRGFFVDRFFAGGTESIRVRGPVGFWPVRVTIAGFRGSTGCFAFSATP